MSQPSLGPISADIHSQIAENMIIRDCREIHFIEKRINVTYFWGRGDHLFSIRPFKMIPSYYGRSSAVYFFDRIYRINFCGSSPEELVISQGFKDSRVQGFSASGFLWLKSSHALILNEVEHFSKVSIPRELRHRRVLKVAVYIQGFRIQRFKGSGFRG